MESLNLKKIFLQMLIVSIAFSALMGIWVILANEFNDFQGRVLATTLTIVLTSILGLACGAFWESPKSRNFGVKSIPGLGILLTFAAAFITLLMIWKVDTGFRESQIFKSLSVIIIFAFSLSQLSLLSLANLSPKFRWSLTAVYLVVLILATISSVLIIGDFNGESGLLFRILGVLAVLDASLTVMIPIFHRLSRGDFAPTKISILEIEARIGDLKKEMRNLEQQRDEILNRQG